jgi:hypothetical protein
MAALLLGHEVQAIMCGGGRGRERSDSNIPVKIQSKILSAGSVLRGVGFRIPLA